MHASGESRRDEHEQGSNHCQQAERTSIHESSFREGFGSGERQVF
jgi:hypothetical protein